MQVLDTHIGGNIADKREQGNKEDDKGVRDYNEKMQGWFKFVQTEDGLVRDMRYSKEEVAEVINVKKAIASAFQANFEGTDVRQETDTQSLHKSVYK